MTKEEILALDSTELRIEVAEKIFHAKVIGKDGSNPPEFLLVGDKGAGWTPLSGKRWQSAEWYFSEEAAWNDCPEYGESISAAWEVVEKLQATYWVRINSMMGDHFCGVGKPEMWEYRSKSMPEAICKASLLAVMEGKDEES